MIILWIDLLLKRKKIQRYILNNYYYYYYLFLFLNTFCELKSKKIKIKIKNKGIKVLLKYVKCLMFNIF